MKKVINRYLLKDFTTKIIYIIKGNVPAEKQSTTFFWEEIF
jgi:hypothetical protein